MEAYRGFLLFFFFFRVSRGVHAHTFSVILILSNYRKCMGKSRFSKIWSRTSLHSRFSVLFLWTRKLLFSNTKHQMKYMNSGRNSGLWNKSSNFPPSCPDYPWCNYERELLCCEIIKKLNLALWLSSNGWQMLTGEGYNSHIEPFNIYAFFTWYWRLFSVVFPSTHAQNVTLTNPKWRLSAG